MKRRRYYGIAAEFIAQEVWRMSRVYYAKTNFGWLPMNTKKGDLLAISAKLAETPCSPLYKGPASPDRALHELVNGGCRVG